MLTKENLSTLLSIKPTPTLTCTISIAESGVGFAYSEETDETLFLPPSEAKKLRNGDVAKICRNASDENKGQSDSGLFYELVEANTSPFVCEVVTHKEGTNYAFLKDKETGDRNEYYCNNVGKLGLKRGDLVIAEIIKHPSQASDPKGSPKVKFLKVISKHDDPAIQWKLALAVNNIDASNFPDVKRERIEPTENQFNRLGYEVDNNYYISIDGACTEDIDDAINIQKVDDDNFILSVAIADPSSFVDTNTTVFHNAIKKGTTFYSPGCNLKMLPDCIERNFSLFEGVERPSLVCQAVISTNGDILSYRFKKAIITVKQNLTYTQVSDLIESNFAATPESKNLPVEMIQVLNDMAMVRRAYRENNNAKVNFDDDFKFIVQNWEPIGVQKDVRRIGQKVVEEAMIVANTATGMFLKEHGKGIFSSFVGFNPDLTLKEVQQAFVSAGLEKEITNDHFSPDGFMKLARELEESGDQSAIKLIRGLSDRSKLSLNAGFHCGVFANAYATFTSPLRKASDLINHLVIKAIIENGNADAVVITEEMIESISEGIYSNRKAERKIIDHLTDRYLELNPDKAFEGQILHITKKCIIVRLDETNTSVKVSSFDLGTREKPANFDIIKQTMNTAIGDLKLDDKLSIKFKKLNPKTKKVTFLAKKVSE